MGGYAWEVATGAGAIMALELRTQVAKEQVRNSVLAFKRQNYPVDPDNLEHQEKHRQMRLKFNRASPAQFAKCLGTGKEEEEIRRLELDCLLGSAKDELPEGIAPEAENGRGR